jgi:pre-mRNA-processing factor SLU7
MVIFLFPHEFVYTKYLLNPDVNSAYYDPKTRSMREDPLPDVDPNDNFYVVSN